VNASAMTAERLEGLLEKAQRPVTVTPPAAVGTTVEAKDLASGRLLSYALVEPQDARPSDGMLSIASPVGAALRGRSAGDEVVVGTPRGERRLLIINVS
jgi:transcription elongation factor GreA